MMGRLMSTETRELRESLLAVLAVELVLWVLDLLGPEIVEAEVSPERGLLVEGLTAVRAGKGLGVAAGVLQQLMLLMETFGAAIAEETLLFIELSATPALLLPLLVLLCTCLSLRLTLV